MMDNGRSDLLDTTAGKTLSNDDREALRGAPHSGNSPHATGLAGTVMSDQSYIDRGDIGGLNPDANSSGVPTQTINPGQIEAARASELGSETDLSGGENLAQATNSPVEQAIKNTE